MQTVHRMHDAEHEGQEHTNSSQKKNMIFRPGSCVDLVGPFRWVQVLAGSQAGGPRAHQALATLVSHPMRHSSMPFTHTRKPGVSRYGVYIRLNSSKTTESNRFLSLTASYTHDAPRRNRSI